MRPIPHAVTFEHFCHGVGCSFLAYVEIAKEMPCVGAAKHMRVNKVLFHVFECRECTPPLCGCDECV